VNAVYSVLQTIVGFIWLLGLGLGAVAWLLLMVGGRR
jgi:hypothetical protein